MASFSRLSFSSYSFGGFSIDFEPTPEPSRALNPLAIAVHGIGFGSLLVAAQGFANVGLAFVPAPWRTFIVMAEARGMPVPADPRRALTTSA